MSEGKREKYISCKWLESGVCFDNGVYGSNVKLCCYMSAPGGGNSMIFEDYHGEKIDWNEFFKIKNCGKRAHNFHKKSDTNTKQIHKQICKKGLGTGCYCKNAENPHKH